MQRSRFLHALLSRAAGFLFFAASAHAQALAPLAATERPPADGGEATPTPAAQRFAVLGDYGLAGPVEASVAALVHAMEPDWIVTVGDNNYPNGEAATIDANVGQYYHDYIAPYQGTYGPGATINRFFPSPGNHDWNTPGLVPYLDYFDLPGNERYYDVRKGPVHLFLVNSDTDEPDGILPTSVQAQWLADRLAASGAALKLVFFHHAPYSSSLHGPDLFLQWPFAEWGADAVFAGHDHVYERLDADGIPFFVNGVGGNPALYPFEALGVAGSRLRYRMDFGAQFIDAAGRHARVRFVTRSGLVVDDLSVFPQSASQGVEPFIPGYSVWRYHDLGFDPGAGWQDVGFDDSGWGSGQAHLGYGDGDEITVISFGPDPDDKYITTYLRHAFSVSDAASVTELRLDLLADDGAVCYLNGTEVVRQNMPAGPITNTTPAASTVGDNIEDSLYEWDVDPSVLVDGPNVLAVSLHQRAPTSTDTSFDLKLLGYRSSEVLVPAGSVWNYLDDGTDPGADWTSAGFDDGSWASGPAELGYGDGGEATTIGFGGDPLAKHITTYFRHDFTVADADAWNDLRLRLRRDDGAIVYLNGSEVHRFNLPLTHGPDTTAGFEVTGGAEIRFFEARIDHRRLRTGPNVLAVELHQVSATDDDTSFDLELVGRP